MVQIICRCYAPLLHVEQTPKLLPLHSVGKVMILRNISYTHRRSKFGAGVPVKGRREYVPVGSMPAPCRQSFCRAPRRLLRHCRNLKCERYITLKVRSFGLLRNTHKITYTSSRLCGGLVTRLTGRREYVRVGLTAAIPAADTCQSSHQIPFQPLSKLFHARSLFNFSICKTLL